MSVTAGFAVGASSTVASFPFSGSLFLVVRVGRLEARRIDHHQRFLSTHKLLVTSRFLFEFFKPIKR